MNSPLPFRLTDEELQPSLKSHVKLLDEYGIDVQLLGPRPVSMWHWMRPFLQAHWCTITNQVIAQSVRLYPGRFVGMAQLPQSTSHKDTTPCAEELQRCVQEYGFVGAYLNPDPGGRREVPGVNDTYWYPLYHKAQELGAVLMVHPSASYDPRLEVVPGNFQINNVVEEYIATMIYQNTRVFHDFPRLRVVICHCGGALQRLQESKRANRFENNLFYDTCAYDVDFLTAAIKQKGVDCLLFGSEVPGMGSKAVRPENGRPFDDMVPIIKGLPFLTESDRTKIFYDNAKKVFTLLKV
jgi:predicted TIM-barrel fold metal-dependent hydrolase